MTRKEIAFKELIKEATAFVKHYEINPDALGTGRVRKTYFTFKKILKEIELAEIDEQFKHHQQRDYGQKTSISNKPPRTTTFRKRSDWDYGYD